MSEQRGNSRIADRYVVEQLLGEGSAGTTWIAFDEAFGLRVALKVSRGRAMDAVVASEFSALREVTHPHLVQLLDFGWHEGHAFFTSELIRGRPFLEFAIGRPAAEISTALAHVVSALDCLHQTGLRHGDICSSNILVDEHGVAKLIDLSCAERFGRPRGVSGTAGYIAPEVMRGEDATGQADLFAVGALLRRLGDGLPPALCALRDALEAERPEARPPGCVALLEALGVPSEPHRADVLGPASDPHSRLPSRFVGRRDLIARMEEALRVLDEQRTARVLVVHGPAGVGTSRALRELKWRAQLPRPGSTGFGGTPKVIEVNVHDSSGLTRALIGALEVPPERLASGLIGLAEAVARRRDDAQRKPFVLIVDDAHAMVGRERQLLESLIRMAACNDDFVLVMGSRSALDFEAPTLEQFALSPFSRAEIEEILGAQAPSSAVDSMLSRTNGFADSVFAPLREDTVIESRDQQIIDDLRVCDALITPALFNALGWTDQDRAALLANGLIRLEGATLRLRPHAVAFAHAEASPATRRRAASALAQSSNESHGLSEVYLLRAVELFAHLDDLSRALETLDRTLTGATAIASRARAHTALCESFIRSHDLERARVHVGLAADCAFEEGDLQSALALCLRTLRLRPRLRARGVGSARAEYASRLVLIGDVLLQSGLLPHAKRFLLRAVDAAQTDRALCARASSLLSRVLVRMGDYSGALLAAQVDAPTAETCVAAAVAATYGDNRAAADSLLATARSLVTDGSAPRTRIMLLETCALTAYRRGQLAEAAAHYENALELAEKRGYADLAAKLSLNTATVAHQRGTLGVAIARYEQALHLATALGKQTTTALLLFNLARAFADAGAFERSTLAIARAEEAMRAASMDSYRVLLSALSVELLLEQGQIAAAASRRDEDRARIDGVASARELAELSVLDARLAHERNDASLAKARVERAESLAVECGAEDVLLRARLFRASIETPSEKLLALLEDDVKRAHELGFDLLGADLHAALCDAYRRRGVGDLAERHRAQARTTYERVALGLPSALGERFLSHARRARVARSQSAGNPEKPASTDREAKLGRLVEINRRLNSSLRTDDVLRAAMDAAIELTEAERGFLLVRRDLKNSRGSRESSSVLEVATARNIDREAVGKSQMKFSRAIAERVIETGEPAITDNARDDPRFREGRSVHALQLTSVICVPVRQNDDVIGAIYLDHRFRRGRFTEHDVDLLLAFADQVALAMKNAALVAELTRKTRDLEAERQRVAKLLEGRELEISRLEQEVARRTPSVNAIGDIVGEAEPMRRMFAVLGRVIPSTLPILVLGESGVGKELIAKPFTQRARGAMDRSFRSTAPPFPSSFSKRSSLDTQPERSQEQTARAPDSWSLPTREHFFSTRLARCRSECRPSSCDSSKSAKCVRWDKIELSR